MIKNVPVNGTIPKSSSVTFTTKDAVNWQDVTFGLQVTGYHLFRYFTHRLSDKLFEKIATAKISCDSHKIEL